MDVPPVRFDQQRLLDRLFGVAAVASLAPAATLPTVDPDLGVHRAGLLVGCVAVLVGLWLLRRRLRRPAWVTASFAAVALLAAFAGDNVLAMIPLFVALLLVVIDLGPRFGVAFVGAAAAVQATLMTLLTASPPANTAIQTISSTVLMAFMYSFAMLLRRSVAESDARAVLIRERDDANARLTTANSSLSAANEQLRNSIEIEKELVLAEERARSARELHDGLGHRLTLMGMYLDFAERRRETDPDRAWAEVAGARETAHEALAEMRLWVRALNPVRAEGSRGVAAIDAIAESFRGTGVDVRLGVHGEEREVPPGVVLFCHRFVQEGLTNALRHARARRVDIDIDYGATVGEDPALSIALSDDGGGAGAAEPLRHGFGLRSLAERASQLGGTFEAARGDHGVRLSATVPTPSTAPPVVESGTRPDSVAVS